MPFFAGYIATIDSGFISVYAFFAAKIKPAMFCPTGVQKLKSTELDFEQVNVIF